MTPQTLRVLIAQARTLGYEVVTGEQLRPNRWLLTLRDAGSLVLVLAQRRPLLSAADVQDLSDIVRLRCAAYGILLAVGGTFSSNAYQTAAELGGIVKLTVELPQATSIDVSEKLPGALLRTL